MIRWKSNGGEVRLCIRGSNEAVHILCIALEFKMGSGIPWNEEYLTKTFASKPASNLRRPARFLETGPLTSQISIMSM